MAGGKQGSREPGDEEHDVREQTGIIIDDKSASGALAVVEFAASSLLPCLTTA